MWLVKKYKKITLIHIVPKNKQYVRENWNETLIKGTVMDVPYWISICHNTRIIFQRLEFSISYTRKGTSTTALHNLFIFIIVQLIREPKTRLNSSSECFKRDASDIGVLLNYHTISKIWKPFPVCGAFLKMLRALIKKNMCAIPCKIGEFKT